MDSTYADDAMFPCVCQSNLALKGQIVKAVTAIVGAAATYGFRYSFVNDKAKVLIAIRGKLKKSTERDLFVCGGGKVWLPSLSAAIKLMKQEKSLGTIVDGGGPRPRDCYA